MKKARAKTRRQRGPSAASLRGIPEIDFSKAKVRRNPYAARIAKEGPRRRARSTVRAPSASREQSLQLGHQITLVECLLEQSERAPKLHEVAPVVGRQDRAGVVEILGAAGEDPFITTMSSGLATGTVTSSTASSRARARHRSSTPGPASTTSSGIPVARCAQGDDPRPCDEILRIRG